MSNESKIFEFSRFRVIVAERRLERDGRPVPLRSKVFDTLRVLLQNHGHLLTKDQLMDAVWPNTAVEETNLSHNISVLRKALGEKNTGQKFVETVPRLGYRFVGEVREIHEHEDPGPLGPHTVHAALPIRAHESKEGKSTGAGLPQNDRPPYGAQTTEQHTLAGNDTFRQRYKAAVGALAVVFLLVMMWVGARSLRITSENSPRRITVAVIPFENLTGDAGQDYIADGLSEEIIAQLARWNPGELDVIARTSSRLYRETRKSVSRIGSELGADYLVEGSVRRAGERVRVTVHLIHAGNETHLWVRNYERNSGDVLVLQKEVGQAVAQEVGRRLVPPGDVPLPTRNP